MARDDLAFARIYNDIDTYPSLRDVADELGLAYQTVKNRAVLVRAQYAEDPENAPYLINRAEPRAHLNPQTMIDKVVSLADELGRAPTIREARTVMAEEVWTAIFGTYQELLRQAGLRPLRAQAQQDRNVAKHVSVDHYRTMAKERSEYAERYLKPNDRKFKTVLACSDLHDHEIDPFYLRVLIDVAARVQPDVVALTGDVFDLPEFGKYGVDPREWDVVGRIRFVHERILGPLREACPNTQIDFIEGNHEARLLRHLADASPAMRSVLGDLHGWSVAKLLGLDAYEVNYVAKADLGAWNKQDQKEELAKNYKIYWRCLMAHHFPHARNLGLPGWNGHHHSHIVWPNYSPIYGSFEWHQLGAGHARYAPYTEGEKWGNGFLLAHANIETLSTAFEYAQITDHAVVGGKWYEREPSEMVGDRPLMMAA